MARTGRDQKKQRSPEKTKAEANKHTKKVRTKYAYRVVHIWLIITMKMVYNIHLAFIIGRTVFLNLRSGRAVSIIFQVYYLFLILID